MYDVSERGLGALSSESQRFEIDMQLRQEVIKLRAQAERDKKTIQHTHNAQDILLKRVEELEKCYDVEENDDTPFAHPAYYRGHDQAGLVMCKLIHEILDGKEDGRGVSVEPWEGVKRRLLKIQEQSK